jgi:REP element-mobilizing transposase RayT
LQRDAIAELFVNTLYEYRSQGHFQLHAFVVMADHVHLMITPAASLERAFSSLKAGFHSKLHGNSPPRQRTFWHAGSRIIVFATRMIS